MQKSNYKASSVEQKFLWFCRVDFANCSNNIHDNFNHHTNCTHYYLHHHYNYINNNIINHQQ